MRIFVQKTNQQGQSLIEFLLSFTFSFGILFMFIHLAMNASAGYLHHYFTFMAARTYLVADSFSRNDSTAQSDAIKYVNQFVDNDVLMKSWGFSSKGLYFNSPGSKTKPVYVGVYSTASQKLVPMKFFGANIPNMLLRSEAFLGKEPTRAECKERICAGMDLLSPGACSSGGSTDGGIATAFDDGC